MTKEELLQDERIFSAANGDVSYIPLHSLEKFFSQNVVIPKGKNRHPYADVLHEWAENTAKIVECKDVDDNWCESLVNIEVLNLKEYRIRPFNHEYEYQIMFEENGFWSIRDTGYYTEQEIEKFCGNYKKIEETKRERKQ